MDSGAITITFGEQVENGTEMQQIGKKAKYGYTPKELDDIAANINKEGYYAANYYLNELLPNEKTEPASILVIRNGINLFTNSDKLYKEQLSLKWDTKKLMRGTLKNCIARYNLCYADFHQDPDYVSGKGTVYDFKELPYINQLRSGLCKYLGDKAKNLYAEGNYYYDITNSNKKSKCGIGWHGDAERNIIVGARLGPGFCVEYNWYYNSLPVGKRFHCELSHGDLYVMSQKTTGNDWKRRTVFTLRHAAGDDKYLNANGKAEEYVYLELPL